MPLSLSGIVQHLNGLGQVNMLYAIQTLDNIVIGLNLGDEEDVIPSNLIGGELSKTEVELINSLYPNSLPENYKCSEDLNQNLP